MTAGAHLPPCRPGTRWGRAAAATSASVGAMLALASLMRGNLLAMSMVFSSTPSELSTSELSAANIGLGMGRATVRSASGQDSSATVLKAGFASARLDGLCISHTSEVLGRQVTLTITAGDGKLGSPDVSADNAVIDATSLRSGGQAGQSGNGLNLGGLSLLGVASSDVTTTGEPNPLGAPVGTGWYGIDAGEGRLYAVRGAIYDASISGPLSLPGLRITVEPGTGSSCENSALPR